MFGHLVSMVDPLPPPGGHQVLAVPPMVLAVPPMVPALVLAVPLSVPPRCARAAHTYF